VKRAILTGIATALGVMVFSAPASAAVIEFDTNESQPNTGPGRARGSWHVTLDRMGSSQFKVLEIRANTGTEEPNGHVGTITLAFFDKTGTRLQPTGASPGGTDPGRSNWDVAIQPGSSSGDITWHDPNGSNATKLRFDGGTTFGTAGYVTINGEVGQIRASLMNGGKQWTGFVGVPAAAVPEPGSLALALPGLAPLGLALLRRRSKRECDPEEEDDNSSPG